MERGEADTSRRGDKKRERERERETTACKIQRCGNTLQAGLYSDAHAHARLLGARVPFQSLSVRTCRGTGRDNA